MLSMNRSLAQPLRLGQGLLSLLGPLLVLATVGSWPCWAEDPLDLLDNKKAKPKAKVKVDDFDNLLNRSTAGTPFHLVQVAEPSRNIGEQLYWRTLSGSVAAQTAPPEFRVGESTVIAPEVGSSEESEGKSLDIYPTSGQVALEAGQHLVKPGDLPLTLRGGKPSSDHPAIRVVESQTGYEVRVLCAPVRFEVVDEAGRPQPQAIQVAWKGKSLLRQEANFNPLILWLPVGVSYDSSLGAFALSATGKVEARAGSLALGVTPSATGLRKELKSSAAAVANSPAAAPIQLSSRQSITRPNGVAVEPPKFSIYAAPLVEPGQPAWIAIPRRQYELATGQKYEANHFTARTVLGSAPLTLRSAGTPDDKVRAAAVRTLTSSGDDLAWLAVELPATTAGPMAMYLESKHCSTVQLSVLVAERGAGWQLVPYRWRTVFAAHEQATYQLLLARGSAAAQARVFVQLTTPGTQGAGQDGLPIQLGVVATPAVERAEFDARLFTVSLRDLRPGDYRIWAEAGEQQTGTSHTGKVPLTIVDWSRKSPFLVHSMSGCTTCWPTTDEGLATLRAAGLEMATATGAYSLLDVNMPRVDAALAGRLQLDAANLPSELLLRPAANDDLLSRMLRHQLRLIDLTVVRGQGLYNEGLSYHHSYQPSVDRMVRRMQLFTQQTGDYPSFWGVNYSWFPAMGGYTEGGVATDAHTADRNRVLSETLQAAGIEPLSPSDSKWLGEHRADADPTAREKVTELTARSTRYWKAANEAGWGKHNKLYNDAIREVRPDTVFTLFENAGHDEHKRTRDLFGDMTAVCYESYTDHGDWPMSAAFAVDWSRGNSPGQPVWLTTCWGTTPDGMMKSFFHAFARGLAGGGVPMQSTNSLAELARRGMGLRFAGQYGALATHATPDRQVAILSRAAKLATTPRGMWHYHALYYHLTRLGFPPVLLADDEVPAAGIPDFVRVLLLANEELPLEPAVQRAIDAFTARGGRLITVGKNPGVIGKNPAALGDNSVPHAGAIVVNEPLRHLWELKGFMPEAHQQLWQEFGTTWRAALGAALKTAGIVPQATTDADRALALVMDAGPVRYVMAIADAKGTHSNEFEPTKNIPISVAGTGWLVRDLAKQQTLATTDVDGRTNFAIDLLTEPTTLLALYRAAPETVETALNERPRLGGELVLTSRVLAAGVPTAPTKTDLGAVPVLHVLTGPDGVERGRWYRAATDELRCPLPQFDVAGTWQITTEELLTGVTAMTPIEVGPASAQGNTIAAVGDVHIVNQAHLRGFSQRTGEKLVIVEPEQAALMPIAAELTSRLQAAGVRARLWQVRPEEYDTIPLRWYPRPEDTSRLEQIAAGRLIGYQGAMKPYINKLKRSHVPALGGYSDIGPSYLVGQDCIVFSGGRLAESLRAVTAWMDSPHVPGVGQGRLVVCFSPFGADRQVAAVVGNDPAGLAAAAHKLAQQLAAVPSNGPLTTTAKPAGTISNTPSNATSTATVAATGSATAATPATLSVIPSALRPHAGEQTVRAVPQPYAGYQPIERVDKLLANAGGKSVVFLRTEPRSAALVDESGQVTACVELDTLLASHAQIDAAGRLVTLRRRTLEKHASWNFATQIALDLEWIGTAGTREQTLAAYSGATAGLPPDYEGGFVTAGAGTAATGVGGIGAATVLSRPRGLWYRRGDSAWQFYDDLTAAEKRFEVLFPRHAVGGTISPDGRYLFVTMDSRPPTGAFSTPALQPQAAQALLLDLQTGARVWSLRDADYARSTYATHSGYAAVAREGQMTALADVEGVAYLVDKTGKLVVRAEFAVADHKASQVGPLDGVGTWISDDGQLAAFAVANNLLLARADGSSQAVALAGIESACVTHDGSRVVVALRGGQLLGLDAQGQTQWTLKMPTTHSLRVAAVGANRTLVVTGEGNILQLDAAGRQVWQREIFTAADALRKPLAPTADFRQLAGPAEYREPATFALAQSQLSAQQVAVWKPTGKSIAAQGHTFYTVDAPVTLAAGSAKDETFVHLVYRRPAGNKRLTVSLAGTERAQTFELDLPTPEYRVLDLPVGVGARVTISGDGPFELAECGLWSYRWPGPNVAFVQGATSDSVGDLTARRDQPKLAVADDDLLNELGVRGSEGAGIKKCRIWWPNSDPDQVAGPYLRVPIDPTQIVDGRWFDARPLAPWATNSGNFQPTRGAFFTVDFGKPQPVTLVTTYDRATRQSEVCRNLAVFAGDEPDFLYTGKLLAGDTDNDQFWRLFPVASPPLKILGVHVFKDAASPVGLSEMGAYKK